MFYEIEKQVHKQLKRDLESLSKGSTQAANHEEANSIDYMAISHNCKKRNQEGFTPIRPYIEKIEKMESVSDYQAILTEWSMKKLPTPFWLSVEKDGQEASKNVFYLRIPSTFLQEGPDYHGQKKAFESSMTHLLQTAGYDAKLAKKFAQDPLLLTNY